MNQPNKSEQFDVESLRRKVSEIRTGDGKQVEANAPELNPLARQIAEQFRNDSTSPTMLIGQFRLFELAALLAISLLVGALMAPIEAGDFLARFALIASGVTFTVLLLQLADTYQIPSLRSASRTARRVLIAWTIGFAATAAVLYLAEPRPYSLSALTVWFFTGAVFLFLERRLTAFAIRNWARNGVMERRAVIVGGGEPAKRLVRELEQQPDNDIRICGIFDDRGSERSPTVVAGYPKLGTFAELVEFARLARIDMLIIALPASAEQRILQLLRKLWVLPVDIRLAAHANRLRFRPRSYSHVGAVPMFDIFDKPIRDWDSVAKRIFDIAFSLVAITLLWPVMLAAAIAVKANSKGPVLFRQKRHGFNNEVIEVLKFRSMYTNMSDQSAIKAVTKSDPRVTPVGRFLRKSSIDELPQLFNVLRGELSLVGPRPHAVSAQTGTRKYVDVVESYFARHRVKPGVTGWAQINGLRGELDSDEKIRARTAYDLDYIENWSLLFDLKILFLTPVRLLNTDNAY
ncbi:undecaprenyl-phosphate glucose phosphotransferase [Rhizobium puerariae]|uniref:Undecaprenyl-phosphate glucose phosphotransferase n=1 Tax=Rhizobium puerariae TaxID=1585791 RepID=A0ABV6AP57_9HYPH